MKITLTNDFHNSESIITIQKDGMVSQSQVKKVHKELCGIKDCTCSGQSGQRGRQEWVIVEISQGNFKAVKSNTL